MKNFIWKQLHFILLPVWRLNYCFVQSFQRIPNYLYHHHHHRLTLTSMPRGIKKEHLPSKICVICNRPFTWRKKWERCWDEVTTCSKSCNHKRRQNKSSSALNLHHHSEYDITDTNKDIRRHNVDDGQHDNDIQMELLMDDTSQCLVDDALEKHERSDEIIQESLDSCHLLQEKIQVERDGLSTVCIKSDDSLNTEIINEQESMTSDEQIEEEIDPVERRKAERKALKKQKKAERRAQREGRGDPSAGQKECDMCGKRVNLLIRCTYDESLQWKMVCGSCWKIASGGVVDGDASHPNYRYGGLWKNRRQK